LNILGIDFEDWFHPELIQKYISDNNNEPKVIEGIDRILELLRLHDTKATFFVVGELLEFKPELLDMILENGHEIAFHTMKHTRIDSPNFKEKFLRTRIRNYLYKFKLDGLDINKVKLTLSNLQSANESINFYKEKSIKNYVRYLQRNSCFVSYGLFNYESEEVIFRTINDIISKISDGYYPPRGKDVKNLISRIQSEKFKKSTLGGCIIEKTYNILIFRKEFEA